MHISLGNQLVLERCPMCNIHKPLLNKNNEVITKDGNRANQRYWRIYICSSCGGVITAFASSGFDQPAIEIYPQPLSIDENIPVRARKYLQQAIESLHSPDGAVMLAGSAVDALFKAKELTDGSLDSRIKSAVANHLITPEMGEWAHDVRLESNEPRHADEEDPHADESDAKRVIDFALALAEFLFVLPARVEKGRAKPGPGED